MSNQKTLRNSIDFEGVGLHTGNKVKMTLEPAKENFGIKFQRIDLENSPIIPASIDLVNETQRSTTLEKDGIKIITVEHIMSALYAMGVNNVLVKINNPEIPILDGSSRFFVEEIQKVGLKNQTAPLNYVKLNKPIHYVDKETGSEILFVPANNFILSVLLDYENPVLGTQYAEIRNLDNYSKEIANCKTFVLLTELEKLSQANLIKGGDLHNAIVLVDRSDIKDEEIRNLAHLLGKDATDIKVNGNILGTIAYDDTVQTITIPNINIENNVSVVIDGNSTSGNRVKFDDLFYTCYTALGIEEFNSVNVKLHPNPFKNNLTVVLNSDIETNVEIFDILGKRVFQNAFNRTSILNLQALKTGIYILRISQNNKTISKKLVKQ